jgi:hypothetical protein
VLDSSFICESAMVLHRPLKCTPAVRTEGYLLPLLGDVRYPQLISLSAVTVLLSNIREPTDKRNSKYKTSSRRLSLFYL